VYLAVTRRRPSLDQLLAPKVLSALTGLVSVPGGAVLLASLLGLVAVPTVIFGVTGYDMGIDQNWSTSTPGLPPLSPAVVSAAIGAVGASVLIAAPIGAFVIRRHAVTGALLTFGLAWFAGILALPVAPSLLGYSYGAVNFCLDSCYPQIVGISGGIDAFMTDHTPDPFALLFSPFYGFLPMVALIIGISLWAPIVRRAADQQGSNR
jgi:hypothetical protein